jgi:adenylate kinase
MGAQAVILLGPPGAGKGTQGRMLGVALGYPRISTGDILREAVRNQTVLGKKAQGFMESGNLVPDALVDAIVEERIKRDDCAQGFILDGYPRTVPQAEFLGGILTKESAKPLAVGIQVADQALVTRLSGRLTCPSCSKMFHVVTSPSKAGESCDECGTALIQRKDDTVKVIEERLQVYHQETEPLIDFYTSRDCYVEVDGGRSVDEIQAAILEVVRNRQARSSTTR